MLNVHNLRMIRTFLGLHQSQLAKMIGVDGSYIAHIEGGKRPLTDEMRNKVVQALHLTSCKVAKIVTAQEAYESARRSVRQALLYVKE